MPIVATGQAASTNNTVTLTPSAAVQSGDVVVAAITGQFDFGSTTVTGTPAFVDVMQTGAAGSGVRPGTMILRRIAGASEPASYRFELTFHNANDPVLGSLVVIRGAASPFTDWFDTTVATDTGTAITSTDQSGMGFTNGIGLMIPTQGGDSTKTDWDWTSYTNDFGEQTDIASTLNGISLHQGIAAYTTTNGTVPATTATSNKSGNNYIGVYVVATCPCDVHDTFTRTVVDGLGSADVGGAYTLEWDSFASADATRYRVDGSRAKLVHRRGDGDWGIYGLLSSSDVHDIYADFTPYTEGPDDGGSRYVEVRLLARYTSLTSHYRLEATDTTSGLIRLRVIRNDAVFVAYQTSTVTGAYGTTFRLRFRVALDGAVQAKIWLPADPEPATWLLSTTDATPLTASGVGFGQYGNASALAVDHGFYVDNFSVNCPCPPPLLVTAAPFIWIW